MNDSDSSAFIPSGSKALPDGTFITPEGLHISRTGAVMGRPEAEHSQYGLVKDREGKNLPEPQIRGVEGGVRTP